MIFFKKYKFIVLSILIFIGISLFLYNKLKIDKNSDYRLIQEKFKEKELLLSKWVDTLEYRILKNSNFSDFCIEKDVFLHVFQGDSLIFWNSNKMPISRFVDIHFPINGLSKFQNAWYYSSAQKVNNKIVVASFLIANEFKGQNQYLLNQLNSDFKIKQNAKIVLDKEIKFPIYNLKNKYQFSINFYGEPKFDFFENISLLLGIFLFYIVFFLSIYKNLNSKFKFTSYIFLHIVFIYLSNFYLEKTSWIFVNREFYSHSFIFPSYYVLSSLSYILFIVTFYLNKIFYDFKNKLNFTLVCAFNLFYIVFINFFIYSNLTDSGYFIQLEKLLSWNMITGTFFVFSTFLIYFSIPNIKLLVKFCLELYPIYKNINLYIFLIILIGLNTFEFVNNEILIYFICVYIVQYINLKFNIKNWISTIFTLIFASYILTLTVNSYNQKRENNEKEIYAEQLSTDRDILLELEYQKSDSICSNLLRLKKYENFSVKDLNQIIDKCFNSIFWERYELDFKFIEKENTFVDSFPRINQFEKIIKYHSTISDLCNNLYFIKDFTSHLSYIARKKIKNNKYLYITFKSKKIPEKIGFPRLLISDNSQVIKVLEKYSIAKYYNGNLVSENGKFTYPNSLKWIKNRKKISHIVDFDGYKHFVYIKNNNDVLIISKEDNSLYVKLSTFSFLFICYFLVFIFDLFIQNYKENRGLFTLSLKIQGSLYLLSFLFIIIFTVIFLYFIRRQFDESENFSLIEKTISIENSFNDNHNELKENINVFNFFDKIILDWKNMLQTDINVYNNSGYLISSTEPRLYNYGVLGEFIDFNTKHKLLNSNKKTLILQENIGQLNFKSAYFIISNNNSYNYIIQLTQFRKQEDFENKVEEFLLSLINLLNLLLIFSLFISLIISNWLSKPLKVIQKSLSKMQLGKYNEPIPYMSDDELGQLVMSYNQKINELSLAANQLAQSERESAWREMAKQIAHEVKNPLTPMKLSLQQFQRVFDPNEPQIKEKLNQLIVSLISQIDSLVQITNEFSHFAKLPKENFEKFNLCQLIENCVQLYNKEGEINFVLSFDEQAIFINGDKNLILHVFNNLIINAIQAQNFKNKKEIQISVMIETNYVIIKIRDEGVGISDEDKSEIFKQNFTTKLYGSGIGLAFVKQIILAHKGNIYFYSEKDKYTEFIIHLPIV